MDQFKFSLGPFEIFSAVVGGIPLLIAGCLLYSPFESLQDFIVPVRENSSLSVAIALLIFSYLIGAAMQGISWKYFLFICKLFHHSYNYFGGAIQQKNSRLPSGDDLSELALQSLDFESRIAVVLRRKIGIPKRHRWMDARIMAYLREHNRQSTLNAIEHYTAQHIMYRTWSLGFCAIAFVVFINPFRTGTFTLEQWLLPFVSVFFAYAAFFQALQHQRWRNRELILGFYFAETERGDL